jgi:hypothetical protein
MKYLLNRKLFELFELFDKKVRNYSLFDKFLNPYLNPSLAGCIIPNEAEGITPHEARGITTHEAGGITPHETGGGTLPKQLLTFSWTSICPTSSSNTIRY